MRREDWYGRGICFAITFGLAWLKLWLYPPDNNLLSVGISACLSVVCNTVSMIAAASFVKGRASFDLQRLAYCAMVVNLLSFIAYAAKNSPCVFFLNTSITVISYVQLIRLLWPSNGDNVHNNKRDRFLHFTHISGKNIHLEKKK